LGKDFNGQLKRISEKAKKKPVLGVELELLVRGGDEKLLEGVVAGNVKNEFLNYGPLFEEKFSQEDKWKENYLDRFNTFFSCFLSDDSNKTLLKKNLNEWGMRFFEKETGKYQKRSRKNNFVFNKAAESFRRFSRVKRLLHQFEGVFRLTEIIPEDRRVYFDKVVAIRAKAFQDKNNQEKANEKVIKRLKKRYQLQREAFEVKLKKEKRAISEVKRVLFYGFLRDCVSIWKEEMNELVKSYKTIFLYVGETKQTGEKLREKAMILFSDARVIDIGIKARKKAWIKCKKHKIDWFGQLDPMYSIPWFNYVYENPEVIDKVKKSFTKSLSRGQDARPAMIELVKLIKLANIINENLAFMVPSRIFDDLGYERLSFLSGTRESDKYDALDKYHKNMEDLRRQIKHLKTNQLTESSFLENVKHLDKGNLFEKFINEDTKNKLNGDLKDARDYLKEVIGLISRIRFTDKRPPTEKEKKIFEKDWAKDGFAGGLLDRIDKSVNLEGCTFEYADKIWSIKSIDKGREKTTIVIEFKGENEEKTIVVTDLENGGSVIIKGKDGAADITVDRPDKQIKVRKPVKGNHVFPFPGYTIFSDFEFLGKGAYGYVYLGYDENGRRYSIKSIERRITGTATLELRDREAVLREILYSQMVTGEHFGKVLAMIESENTYYVLFHYLVAPNFDETTSIDEKEKCVEHLRIAVTELIAQGYVHRDVAHDNFMYSQEDEEYKLIDFGGMLSARDTRWGVDEFEKDGYFVPGLGDHYSTHSLDKLQCEQDVFAYTVVKLGILYGNAVTLPKTDTQPDEKVALQKYFLKKNLEILEVHKDELGNSYPMMLEGLTEPKLTTLQCVKVIRLDSTKPDSVKALPCTGQIARGGTPSSTLLKASIEMLPGQLHNLIPHKHGNNLPKLVCDVLEWLHRKAKDGGDDGNDTAGQFERNELVWKIKELGRHIIGRSGLADRHPEEILNKLFKKLKITCLKFNDEPQPFVLDLKLEPGNSIEDALKDHKITACGDFLFILVPVGVKIEKTLSIEIDTNAGKETVTLKPSRYLVDGLEKKYRYSVVVAPSQPGSFYEHLRFVGDKKNLETDVFIKHIENQTLGNVACIVRYDRVKVEEIVIDDE